MIKPLSIVIAMSILSSLSLFSSPIAVGEPAPVLTVTIHTGEKLNLADVYKRGPVLIYFYPKSDTPGCTAQACNLRDAFEQLYQAGLQVIGVSTDRVDRQAAFVERHQLPFPIVADPERELGKAFGVGSIMGTLFRRQSFLVADGKIVWRDLSASPANQAGDALSALQQLDIRN